MAQKGIREADGKGMLARLLPEYTGGGYTIRNRFISVGPETNLTSLPGRHPWLLKEQLTVKVDQLTKRRRKNGLVLLDADWKDAKRWIKERMNTEVTVDGVTGVLERFIVEPFVPHDAKDEHYVAIVSQREGDDILFHHDGGINIGDVDATAVRLPVPIGKMPTAGQIEKKLLGRAPKEQKGLIAGFIEGLFKFYADLNYTYLEINPFIVHEKGILPLDMAAKLDDTAAFVSGKKWGKIPFPTPFGRMLTKEEAYIEDLDSKTGSSLKLTVLHPEGRVWTMTAGGGASVIYADTITDLGFMDEMANYGEYSGDPNEEVTYLYAKTILDLMTRKKDPRGKFFLIGGGIANFTDVATTFRGIIRALREYCEKLKEGKVKIFVRRGGPNYKEGLDNVRALGEELDIPIHVCGPETHMTRIISMALKGDR
ncbi:MAG: ATP citrate lyase citrate-binding domain-containing protein [Methanoculleaceae archaeon]